MMPFDSLLRLWRYINPLLAYYLLLSNPDNALFDRFEYRHLNLN